MQKCIQLNQMWTYRDLIYKNQSLVYMVNSMQQLYLVAIFNTEFALNFKTLCEPAPFKHRF